MTTTTTDPAVALHKALAAAQAEMPTVPKSKTAKAGSYSYSYADLADVMTAVAPVLSKHGLAVTTTTEQAERGWLIVGRLVHDAGGSISASLPAQFAGGPQQIGSELTYARRYLLGMLTGVVTDDDDDGQAAQHAPQRQAPQAVISKPTPAPDLSPMDEMVAAMREAGVADTQMLDYARAVTGRDDLSSAADLTDAEIQEVKLSAIMRVTPEMIGRQRREAAAEAEAEGQAS